LGEGEEEVRKSLLIVLPVGKDLGDLVQIARAEGKKLLRGCCVKVVDADRRSETEWVVVVQDF
jgi:hypothetical protein